MSSSAVRIRRAEVSLNHEQMLALPSTQLEIVPSERGKVMIPLYAFIYCDTSGGGYTNIDALATLGVVVSDPPPSGLNSPQTMLDRWSTIVGDIIGEDSNSTCWGYLVPIASPGGSYGYDPQRFSNAGIWLYLYNGASGNLTGGDPANFLSVEVLYTTVSVPW